MESIETEMAENGITERDLNCKKGLLTQSSHDKKKKLQL